MAHYGHIEHGSSGDPAVPVVGADGKRTYVPASQANQFYELQSELASAATDGGEIPPYMPEQKSLFRRLFRKKR